MKYKIKGKYYNTQRQLRTYAAEFEFEYDPNDKTGRNLLGQLRHKDSGLLEKLSELYADFLVLKSLEVLNDTAVKAPIDVLTSKEILSMPVEDLLLIAKSCNLKATSTMDKIDIAKIINDHYKKSNKIVKEKPSDLISEKGFKETVEDGGTFAVGE